MAQRLINHPGGEIARCAGLLICNGELIVTDETICTPPAGTSYEETCICGPSFATGCGHIECPLILVPNTVEVEISDVFISQRPDGNVAGLCKECESYNGLYELPRANSPIFTGAPGHGECSWYEEFTDECSLRPLVGTSEPCGACIIRIRIGVDINYCYDNLSERCVIRLRTLIHLRILSLDDCETGTNSACEFLFGQGPFVVYAFGDEGQDCLSGCASALSEINPSQAVHYNLVSSTGTAGCLCYDIRGQVVQMIPFCVGNEGGAGSPSSLCCVQGGEGSECINNVSGTVPPMVPGNVTVTFSE